MAGTAEELRELLLHRLATTYEAVGVEEVYDALQDILLRVGARQRPERVPPPVFDPDHAAGHFRDTTILLVLDRFATLTPTQLGNVLAQAAHEMDRARRSSGMFEAVSSTTHSTIPRASSASHRTIPAAEGPAPSPRSGPGPVAGGRLRAAFDAQVHWRPEAHQVRIRFADQRTWERFADQGAAKNTIELLLDPVPELHTAVRVEILVTESVCAVSTAVASATPTGVSLRVIAFPDAWNRAAFAERKRRSSSSVPAVGATPVPPRASGPSPDGVSERPPSGVSPVIEPVRRRRAPTPESPPPMRPDPDHGFDREETTSQRADLRRKAARARRAARGGSSNLSDTTAAELARLASKRREQRDTSAGERAPAPSAGRTPARDAPQGAGTAPPTGSHPVVAADFARERSGLRASVPASSEFVREGSSGLRASVPASSEFARESSGLRASEPASSEFVREGSSGLRTSVPASADVSTESSGSWGAADARPRVGELLARHEGGPIPGGPAAVLLRASAEHAETRVEIESEDGVLWTAWLREELLLGLETSPPQKRYAIARLVAESGLVPPETLSEQLAAAESQGSDLLELLGRNRILRFRQLDAIANARFRLMLADLFRSRISVWQIFAYHRIESHPGLPQVAFAPHAWKQLLDEAEGLSQAELDALLRARKASRPRYRQGALLSPGTLGMEAKARRFIDTVVSGESSVGQALAKSPLRKRPSQTVLVALDRAGLLDWIAIDAEASRVDRAMPAIAAKLTESRSADPFEVLESHWSCDEVLILDSWRHVTEQLDIDYVIGHGDPDQRQSAERLRDVLSAARDRLQRREDRRAEREKVADTFNITTAKQLYERQAELALFKNDFEQAADAMRRVVELDPRDAAARGQLQTILAAIDS